jgi:hypothetical protein
MGRLLLVLAVALVMAALMVVAAPAMASHEDLLVACHDVIRTADTDTVLCSADDNDEFGRAPSFECEETFRLKGTTYCPVDADEAFKQFVIDEEFRERVGPLR